MFIRSGPCANARVQWPNGKECASTSVSSFEHADDTTDASTHRHYSYGEAYVPNRLRSTGSGRCFTACSHGVSTTTISSGPTN